jgi:hypothetical protein
MKLGANEPCRCGSGRKYKKCCWEKDEAVEALVAREHRTIQGQEPDKFGHEWDGEDYFSGADCVKCGVHVYEPQPGEDPVGTTCSYVLGELAWLKTKPSCPPDPKTHDAHARPRKPCGVEFFECLGSHQDEESSLAEV